MIWQGPIPSDDAYITFRHVRNLLLEGRPAWNLEGRPVLGTTSPGFMFALAAFCRVLGIREIGDAALYLNGVFHGLAVGLSVLAGLDILGRARWAIPLGLLIGVNSVNIYMASEGFESAMFLVVALGSTLASRRHHDIVAAILSSAAPLVRPEGLLLVPLVWGVALWRGRVSTRFVLTSCALPLIWTVWATAYFGSPVSHSITAKRKLPSIYHPYSGGEVSLIERAPDVLPRTLALWRNTASGLFADGRTAHEFDTSLEETRRFVVLWGIPPALLALVWNARGVAYLVYPVLFLILYGLIGHTQPWYFPSFVSFSILVVFCGGMLCMDGLTRILGKFLRLRIALVVSAVLKCGIVGLLLTGNEYRLNRGEFDYAERGPLFPPHPWGASWDRWEAQRFQHYREVAEFLNGHASRCDQVLSSEVGVLGYFFRGNVIDAVGLCSPEALAFYPPPKDEIFDGNGNDRTSTGNFVPWRMIESLKPRFVANSRAYLRNLLTPGSKFLDQYSELYRGGRVWGEPVVAFERKASANQSPAP